MKSLLIAAVLALGLLFSAMPAGAQLKGFSLGPYFETAWPQGKFAATNSQGIGAGLSADVKLGPRLSALGSYGVLHFGIRPGRETSMATAVNALPLRAGLKFKLPLLYFKLEGGSAKFTDGSGAAIILSPGIGFRFLGIDAQASYETWLKGQARSFAGVKLAYHF